MTWWHHNCVTSHVTKSRLRYGYLQLEMTMTDHFLDSIESVVWQLLEKVVHCSSFSLLSLRNYLIRSLAINLSHSHDFNQNFIFGMQHFSIPRNNSKKWNLMMRDVKQFRPGMSTILVKTILNTNNNTSTINYCQYQYQYFCDSTSAWNSLPSYIQEQSNTDTFKRHLKTFLFEQCYSSSSP